MVSLKKISSIVISLAVLGNLSAYSAQNGSNILQKKLLDINGDGKKEIIELVAYKGTDSYEKKVDFIVKDYRNNKTLIYKNLGDYIENVNMILGDFDGDRLPDILLNVYSGGTAYMCQGAVYSYRGNKLKTLFYSNDETSTKLPVSWDAKLLNNDRVNIFSKVLNKSYILDIKSNPMLKQYKSSGQKYSIFGDGRGPVWSAVDINKDKVYELSLWSQLDGLNHADVIAGVTSYYKYIPKTKSWKLVNIDVKPNYPLVK